MSERASLRQVAELARVAVPTASRVLNNDSTVQVRDDTRRRILRAARELAYTPNSVARSLRESRAGAIGLVMHDLDSPINVAVLNGAQARCTDADYVTLLADAEDLREDDSQLRALLASGRLDGVIFQTGYGPGDQLVEEMAGTVPAVLVNSAHNVVAPAIQLDDAAAGALATNHLASLGHDHVTFIGGPSGAPSSTRREAGFHTVLNQHQITGSVVSAGWTAKSGANVTQRILQNRERPTAIVVGNAVTAAGVMSTLRDAEISVPEEVSVVAIHDPWFVPHLAVALTTVRMPLFELGEAAASTLLEGLSHGHMSDRFVTNPPPELIVRQSTTRRR